MNEIDLPTMTPEERQLLLGPAHPVRDVMAWWLPTIIACIMAIMAVVLVSKKSQSVPEGIMVNPDTAICASHPELSQSGWLRVPESDRQRIAADGRYRILSAQTIVCTDGAQSFQLREWWYKQEKSTWRRQGLAVHKE